MFRGLFLLATVSFAFSQVSKPDLEESADLSLTAEQMFVSDLVESLGINAEEIQETKLRLDKMEQTLIDLGVPISTNTLGNVSIEGDKGKKAPAPFRSPIYMDFVQCVSNNTFSITEGDDRYNAIEIPFPEPFPGKPIVFTSIGVLHSFDGVDTRFAQYVDAETLTNSSFTFICKTWGDSVIMNAAIHYMAFYNP